VIHKCCDININIGVEGYVGLDLKVSQ